MSSKTEITIPEDVLTKWAADCLHINHHGTLIKRALPKTSENTRAIDLAERAQRRAWELFKELVAHGARKPEGYQEPDANE